MSSFSQHPHSGYAHHGTNNSFTSFPNDAIEQSLSSRFEQQAKQYSGKVAIKTESYSLTYDALNQTANRIAHALIERGGNVVEPVALLCEQGPLFIASIIGILKAGKFYIPLDSSYSSLKIASIIKSAQSRLVVSNTLLSSLIDEALGNQLEYSTLNIDCLDEHLSTENPCLSISPDIPAYIFYTSGTTGKPKGVVDNHRNVLHNIMRYTNSLHINSNDGLTLLQSCSFSGSVSNIFGALLNGATLFPFDIQQKSIHKMVAWLNQEAITIYHSVPAIFRAFLSEDRQFNSIRIIRLEGDKASKLDFELYKKHFSDDCILVNGLGATECGIIRQYFIKKDTKLSSLNLPIGYPTQDMNIVLLDDDGNVVHAGDIGEIVVESPYLAIGYWNEPDATDAAFHYDAQRHVRQYHTGDLGRLRPDGCLEYIGRKNFQAKMRGYRIDYAEIELELLHVDGIADAVVHASEDSSGEQRLIAYLVPAVEPAPTVTAIRRILVQTLTEHMIPSTFVFLKALPLNSNKKVDRKALPIPGSVRPTLEAEFVASQTPMEEKLSEIWSDLLKIDHIGIHDNFFELGGNSLLSAQMITRLHKMFGIELSQKALFSMPTIAKFAQQITQIQQEEPKAPTLPLVAVNRGTILPLSFAQQRLWIEDQMQYGRSTYNVPLVLRLEGVLNQTALKQSLEAVVERHEVLRTTFEMRSGVLIQVIAQSDHISLPIYDISSLPPEKGALETTRFLEELIHRPFDLKQGPVFQAALLHLNDSNHIALLVMHHIIADGWSMSLLLKELTAFYLFYANGQTPLLPPLPIQYVDYAIWQKQWLRGAFEEMQLNYWRNQLANLPTLQMPTDYPRPPKRTFEGMDYVFKLPSSLYQGLGSLCRAEGVTLFMVLLASWQMLLSRYTGQTDIVVGTVVSGRTHEEVENLIGFFLNQLVLRVDLSGDPSFLEVLQRIRKMTVDAYSHQYLPFEKLVVDLNPVRHINISPLFQVMLSLQVASLEAAYLPDLTVYPMEVASTTARFDLVLTLCETTSDIVGTLNYSTELFKAETIHLLAKYYQTVLEEIVAQPLRRLADLPSIIEIELS